MNINKEEIYEKIAQRLAASKRPFVLTGAGLGVASGLDTFRGEGGHWSKYRPEDLSSIHGFKKDPVLVWQWYNERIQKYLDVKPNDGHYALTELQNLLPTTTIVTQNVDGLQKRAGAKDVVEIHGSIFDLKCTGACSNSMKIIGELGRPYEGNKKLENPYYHESCGGLIRPGVVFFGDNLPKEAMAIAEHESMHADIIIVAGTSAKVQPAASLARSHDTSVMLVEINPEPALKHLTGFIINDTTENALPKLIEITKKYIHLRNHSR